jgi:hypothetical protein
MFEPKLSTCAIFGIFGNFAKGKEKPAGQNRFGMPEVSQYLLHDTRISPRNPNLFNFQLSQSHTGQSYKSYQIPPNLISINPSIKMNRPEMK